MPEILTESFCERCGTRYTFQSAAPKVGRLAKMKVLSRGFKNYVLSDETSLDEALADARSVDDRETSVEQLDAFHKTFNFCMSCRQYTCQNCWNDREGRCLSCAPSLSVGILPPALPGLNPVTGMSSLVGNGHVHAEGNGHLADAAADATGWPDADLGIAADEIPFAGTAAVEEAPLSRLEALFGREAAARIEAGAPKVDETEPEITSVPEMIGLEKTDAKHREPELIGMEAEAAGEPEAETVLTIVADEPDVEDATAAAEAEIDLAAEAEVAAAEAEIDLEPEALVSSAAPAAVTDEPDEDAAAELAPAPEPVPPVHAVDPETDELAAAAAAQTHGLLDKFRARPEPMSPTPIAATPVSPSFEVPASRPFATPVATPQQQLPYAAIGQVVDPAVPQPFGVIGRPQAPPSPQPYGAQVAMPYAAATGLPYAAPDAPIQPYPAPPPAHPAQAPALHQPFQSGYVAPPPVQSQYAPQPAPPAFTTPPAYPALQPQYPAPAAPPAPSWRMVAPESPYLAPAPSAQGHKPPPPAAGAEPQWPTTPSWPAPLAKGAEAVWAESTRDLLSRPEAGVSACFNCGLPLSATARFCRRCGTSQVSS